MGTLLRASAASLCIGLGVFVLLKVGGVVGAGLFSLGLLTVCCLGLDLFTGRCGFIFAEGLSARYLLKILTVNLIVGYGLGWLFSYTDSTIIVNAEARVAGWECSLPFFLKAAFCGAIMYIAVALYKRGNIWGILLGVPLFILCGFQHCIANIITLGVSHWLGLAEIGAMGCAVAGNFIGAVLVWTISRKRGVVK